MKRQKHPCREKRHFLVFDKIKGFLVLKADHLSCFFHMPQQPHYLYSADVRNQALGHGRKCSALQYRGKCKGCVVRKTPSGATTTLFGLLKSTTTNALNRRRPDWDSREVGGLLANVTPFHPTNTYGSYTTVKTTHMTT